MTFRLIAVQRHTLHDKRTVSLRHWENHMRNGNDLASRLSSTRVRLWSVGETSFGTTPSRSVNPYVCLCRVAWSTATAMDRAQRPWGTVHFALLDHANNVTTETSTGKVARHITRVDVSLMLYIVLFYFAWYVWSRPYQHFFFLCLGLTAQHA